MATDCLNLESLTVNVDYSRSYDDLIGSAVANEEDRERIESQPSWQVIEMPCGQADISVSFHRSEPKEKVRAEIHKLLLQKKRPLLFTEFVQVLGALESKAYSDRLACLGSFWQTTGYRFPISQEGELSLMQAEVHPRIDKGIVLATDLVGPIQRFYMGIY